MPGPFFFAIVGFERTRIRQLRCSPIYQEIMADASRQRVEGISVITYIDALGI